MSIHGHLQRVICDNDQDNQDTSGIRGGYPIPSEIHFSAHGSPASQSTIWKCYHTCSSNSAILYCNLPGPLPSLSVPINLTRVEDDSRPRRPKASPHPLDAKYPHSRTRLPLSIVASSTSSRTFTLPQYQSCW